MRKIHDFKLMARSNWCNLTSTLGGMTIFECRCVLAVRCFGLDVQLRSQSHSQGDGSAVVCSLENKVSFKSHITTKQCLWSLERWSPRDKEEIKYISLLSLTCFSFPGNQVEIVLEKRRYSAIFAYKPACKAMNAFLPMKQGIDRKHTYSYFVALVLCTNHLAFCFDSVLVWLFSLHKTVHRKASNSIVSWA